MLQLMRIGMKNENVIDGASQAGALLGDGPDLTVTEQKQVEDWEPRNLQSSAGLIVQSLESTWLRVPQHKARGPESFSWVFLVCKT